MQVAKGGRRGKQGRRVPPQQSVSFLHFFELAKRLGCFFCWQQCPDDWTIFENLNRQRENGAISLLAFGRAAYLYVCKGTPLAKKFFLPLHERGGGGKGGVAPCPVFWALFYGWFSREKSQILFSCLQKFQLFFIEKCEY